ncbi:unnamed protein product, partial [Symbiodinium pilosum]
KDEGTLRAYDFLQDRVDRETVPVLVHDLVLDMKREGHRMEADKLREAYGLEDFPMLKVLRDAEKDGLLAVAVSNDFAAA